MMMTSEALCFRLELEKRAPFPYCRVSFFNRDMDSQIVFDKISKINKLWKTIYLILLYGWEASNIIFPSAHLA